MLSMALKCTKWPGPPDSTGELTVLLRPLVDEDGNIPSSRTLPYPSFWPQFSAPRASGFGVLLTDCDIAQDTVSNEQSRNYCKLLAVASEPSRRFWYFAATEPSKVDGSAITELS